MKKIVLMLLGVAATINVMAVDFTAKAVVTLQAESGYTCELTLRQSNDYAALSGAEMNMDGRKVALYALNGTTPLQIAMAADLTDVKLGLKSDASTNYTLTVSNVAGTETLYLWDGTTTSYALTEGAVYNFTAAANATDEARFVLKKVAMPTAASLCFNNNILEINAHAGESLVVKAGTTELANVASLPVVYSLDLSAQPADTRVVVTLNGVDYQIDVNPTVTVVP